MKSGLLLIVVGIIITLPIASGGEENKVSGQETLIDTFYIPDFKPEARLLDKWTCKGKDFSPPLVWKVSGVKPKTYAIICEDPDAPNGIWSHWVIFNIPDSLNSLPEGVDTAPILEKGAIQGRNDFGSIGYRGPCPPRGKTHRYYFYLYALSGECSLKPGATRAELLNAMQGKILATKNFYGIWSR